jgi:hypothetical protein
MTPDCDFVAPGIQSARRRVRFDLFELLRDAGGSFY